MTDPEMADRTYIEPILPEIVEKIIAKERPDAILPTMGGQTALNTAVALAKSGVLEKYNVELIGAKLPAIEKAEDLSSRHWRKRCRTDVSRHSCRPSSSIWLVCKVRRHTY